MFRRTSEIAMYGLCVVVLALYVGGVGLALIFAMSILMWLIFNAYSVLPSHSRFLGALVSALLLFVFALNTVIPVLRSFSWLNQRLVTVYTAPIVDYADASGGIFQIIRPWIIGVTCFCFVLCVWPIVRFTHRQSDALSRDHSLRLHIGHRFRMAFADAGPMVVRYTILFPLVVLAYLQNTNPARALTFTMSGDARNFFLGVMRNRINNTFPSFSDMTRIGQLGETLATGLSVTNGTVGFKQMADQYAIRSVYILMMCVILCSLASIVTSHSTDFRGFRAVVRDSVVVILCVFIMVSPYPFAEIFRSGFFSLFVAVGFMVSAAAFIIPQQIFRWDVLGMAILCAGTTFMSYQLAAFVLVPSVVAVTAYFLWGRAVRWKEKTVLLLGTSISLCFLLLNSSSLTDRFVTRVKGGGAIRPTSFTFVVLLFLIGISAIRVSRGSFKYVVVLLSGLAGSSLLAIQVIAWSRGEGYPPYGYYGYKLMYGVNFLMLFSLFAFIGVVLSSLTTESTKKSSYIVSFSPSLIVKSFAIIAAALTIVFCSFQFTSAESPVSTIRKGWNSPSEQTLIKTKALWKTGVENYVFSEYGNDSNDRSANFWSPFFWEPNRWELNYSGYDVSPLGLCRIIDGKKITLITASDDLPRKIRGMCPASVAQMTVQK